MLSCTLVQYVLLNTIWDASVQCGQFNSPVGADPPDLVFGYPFYRLGCGDEDGGDEDDGGSGDHGGRAGGEAA